MAALGLFSSRASLQQESPQKERQGLDRVFEALDRHWKWVVVGTWLAFCIYFVINRWTAITHFSLVDTDDNMRMSQVRALLAGQGC